MIRYASEAIEPIAEAQLARNLEEPQPVLPAGPRRFFWISLAAVLIYALGGLAATFVAYQSTGLHS